MKIKKFNFKNSPLHVIKSENDFYFCLRDLGVIFDLSGVRKLANKCVKSSNKKRFKPSNSGRNGGGITYINKQGLNEFLNHRSNFELVDSMLDFVSDLIKSQDSEGWILIQDNGLLPAFCRYRDNQKEVKSSQIKTYIIDGEAYFLAKDVIPLLNK